jgi:hypothetical protein
VWKRTDTAEEGRKEEQNSAPRPSLGRTELS